MNKNGHLLVTENVIPSELKPFHSWIKIGSILPDLLAHTFLTGHTWNASFEKIMRRLEQLEQIGSLNALSCLYLGYLLHYVEDYFTYPHNVTFQGNLAEHIAYEHKLTTYIQQNTKKNDWEIEEEEMSFQDLVSYLRELHHAYLQEKMGMDIDRAYIEEAAKSVLLCFAVIFGKNKQFFEQATLEAFQLSAKEYYFSLGVGGNV